jgi:hypothetical protein
MQKLITYTSCFLLLAAGTGCKKFLEKEPDNRAHLETPEQVAQLLGTAYPQANYMAFTESISDNVSDRLSGGLDLTAYEPYYFKDASTNQQDSPENYWNGCYTAIAAANEALDAISGKSDTASYSSEKGEALVCRAYAHFMLVTLFSKVYDPNTASSDPGIPYVTTPENTVTKGYERKTVAYTYSMIEKDLVEGISLLDDKRYTIPRYHFTRQAAYAFAARFYLFKQDYAKVVTYANKVFPVAANIAANLRPWNTTYLTLTYREIFDRYASVQDPANLLLVETQSLWARNYYTVRYGMNAAKRSEIFDVNVTGGAYAFRNQIYTVGTNMYMLPKINEYFVSLSVNATIGYPYVMVPLFTAEEVLFNRIEANIYLNNMTDALRDLNIYASTRIRSYDASAHAVTTAKIQSYYGTSDARLGALNAMLDFKRAEYAQEGMRWFDNLRYDMPIEHVYIKNGTDSTFTLGAGDKRRIFQIPEISKQAGLALNPR